MTHDALVEAVARALYAQEWDNTPAPEFGEDGTPKSYWMDAARAALAAIEAQDFVIVPFDTDMTIVYPSAETNAKVLAMIAVRLKQEDST